MTLPDHFGRTIRAAVANCRDFLINIVKVFKPNETRHRSAEKYGMIVRLPCNGKKYGLGTELTKHTPPSCNPE